MATNTVVNTALEVVSIPTDRVSNLAVRNKNHRVNTV